MGRASRYKRERAAAMPTPQGERPRWAGAQGFDYAWHLTEMYRSAAALLASAATEDRLHGSVAVLDHQVSVHSRQLATLDRARHAYFPSEAVMPGRQLLDERPRADGLTIDEIERNAEEDAKRHGPYAKALGILADQHHEALLKTVPILFDPLSTPELDESAIEGLRLPFPVVTCDFLAHSGLCMPVAEVKGDIWVGLVCATLVEQAEGIIDVWPVISTLDASSADDRQQQKSLLFGCVRFGGDLPEPPPDTEITLDHFDGGTIWRVAVIDDDRDLWTQMWVKAPALAAISALRLLDAVNVSLEEATLPRAERRRAARSGAQPALEVVIRASHGASGGPSASGIEWQHRWTVRGHWKHFRKGPIFNANPRKHVTEADGSKCVRVWCPPFVKGPDDKPIVLKARRADHGLTPANPSEGS